jgi:uncharacterized protein (DUF58 family)
MTQTTLGKTVGRSKPRSTWQAWPQKIRQRIAAWARRRHGEDCEPVILHKRRVYILPTRAGITFAVLCFVMLLGALNYDNSMGLALAFLLASCGLVAMHQCHRNLLDVVLRSAAVRPVFAGETAHFRVLIDNHESRARFQLQLRLNDATGTAADIAADTTATLELPLPTDTRGRLRVERFSVTTSQPLGLFRAWSWIHLPLECIVYPRPAAPGTPAPPRESQAGSNTGHADGDEDFSGLRPMRPGDSPRRVAWKTAARGLEPMVKQFAGGAQAPLWLRWDSARGTDPEQRIAILCRWILDADRAGRSFGLDLPGHSVKPGAGVEHRHRCLRALALLPS